MERVVILGAGDLGLSLRTYLADRGDTRLVGYLDDSRPRGEAVDGVEVLGAAADAPALQRAGAFDRVVYAIGYRNFDVRIQLFESLRREGVRFHGVVHPSAYIHKTAKLGEGVHIFPAAVLDMAVEVEHNVVLNTGVILAHHAHIEPHGYFGPGAKVSGFTRVGTGCFVGIGSTIIEKLTVGERSLIAAGAVVTGDVPPRSLMAGVPAVRKKEL